MAQREQKSPVRRVDPAVLLAEGLLDELCLFVHPVVAGTGKRLFERELDRVPLTLLESRAHGNGVVALRYARAA